MSSFKGVDLFGSGPHRFSVGKQGRRLVSYAALYGDLTAEGTFSAGDQELRVTVTGRLTAGSESSLWTKRDAIAAQAASASGAGTLLDGRGRSWEGMTLISFEATGPTDRGRVYSVGYRAEFGVVTG